MATKRSAGAALAAALTLSGCGATGELAREWRDLVSVGMPQDKVFDRLGCPSVVRVEAGPPLEDHWTYRVISEDGTAPLRYAGTVLAIAAVAVVAVAAAKGGGGGGWGGLGGGGGRVGSGAETVWEFAVTFDAGGRVTRISDVRRVR